MCGESRHGEALCPTAPHCVNCSGGHALNDKTCPVYRSEKSFQELRAEEGLSFLEAWTKFLESQAKTGNQSCALALCHLGGIDASTHTAAVPTISKYSVFRTPYIVTASAQTEVTSQSEHSCDPAVPGREIRPYHCMLMTLLSVTFPRAWLH
jgi:hypothetical protein